MREILFRGKRVDNNEWVYGYVYIDEKAHYILEHDENGYRKHFYDYEVIPETIGQYTGLTDKYGKKIFEGDKVNAKYFGTPVYGEIGFSGGCFLLWNSCVSDNQLFIFTDIEVIGNIYDKEVEE